MVQPTLLISFLFLIFHLSITGVISAKFTLVNQCKCNYTVWPASYTTTSSSNSGTTNGTATLSTTGFVLKPGENSTVTAPSKWSGRFWGRTLCKTDSVTKNFSCVTGDCGSGKITCDGAAGLPPATLAEFSLSGSNDLDFYDVSLVDGYNVPMEVIPLGNGKCNSTGCPADLNAVCPTELKVMENETVVACQGPCAAFNLQVFCCAGNHSTPNTCQPSVYAQIFKSSCPQAYSYAYDDGTSTFSCPATDYQILFCPSSITNSSLESLDQGVNVSDSLTAGNGTSRWLSPSGDFAFGFYQLPNELFLLAIWYSKIPNNVNNVVWYANGDNPAPEGSKLELDDSRRLVLTNPQGSELWTSDFTTSGTVSHALMNDTGNFQLVDKNSVVLWDSFSNPTDTLVPNQVLELNGNLSSRQGDSNFSHGRFKLHLQKDGNLVLNLINLPSNYSYEPYYVSGTGIADLNNQTDAGQRLVFNKSGSLYIDNKSGEGFYITQLNETFSADQVYYKATINYDGVFTISYYPKDSTRGQNWIVAETIPENICLYSTFTDGEGVCGFNSICSLRDDQRPNCTCPDGYSFIDSSNMYGGCIPNFQVICQAGENLGSQDDLYTMKELPNTDWPKSDYEIVSPSTLQECKDSCLQDCLCVLVSYNQSSCWKKKLPLSYGRKDQGVNVTSVMKLMKSDPLSSLTNVKKDHDTLIIVISVLLGCSVFVIFILVGVICFGFPYNQKKIKRSRTNKRDVEKNLINFTFKEIVNATNNFGEELGRGSCSIVYKGTIDMISVAVKKLDKLVQDSDKEFQTEMSVIGQTHHRNLVRLLGYCNEGQHRILVYELMNNGTLASFIFTPLKPNWNQRVQIALGIARGLVYLHEGCHTQIIHCDIKPQNILLDDQYNARISDFGLSKLLLINQSRTETGIRGTKGYVAPDWFRSAPITTKVDTYSFGVVLLEIICCRKNVEKEIVSEEKGILTDWAYDCYRSKRLDILLENDEEAVNDMRRLEKFVMIAIWCIQEDPSVRPTMKEVLLMLEGIVEVVIPPSPYLYGSVSYN